MALPFKLPFSLYDIAFSLAIFLAVVVFILFFVAIAIAVIYFASFNKKIILYKKINGIYIPIRKYACRHINIAKTGEGVWQVGRLFPRYVEKPIKYVKKNEAWYYEREADGEWINFGLGDIDNKLKEMNVEIVPSDLKMQRVNLGRWLEQRKKQGFWEKYGDKIINLVFYILMTFCLIIIIAQMGGVVDKAKQYMDLGLQTTQKQTEVYNMQFQLFQGLIDAGVVSPERLYNYTHSGLIEV